MKHFHYRRKDISTIGEISANIALSTDIPARIPQIPAKAAPEAGKLFGKKKIGNSLAIADFCVYSRVETRKLDHEHFYNRSPDFRG